MELVHKAEKALEQPFGALPALPKETKKGLAAIWPWLALIAGVLLLAAVWGLFFAASFANRPELTGWVWVAIIALGAVAAILLMAFPKLQKRQKAGWDLLFLAGLINLFYGPVNLLSNIYSDIGDLLISLLGSAIGFYLLFQVREHFGGKKLVGENRVSDKK